MSSPADATNSTANGAAAANTAATGATPPAANSATTTPSSPTAAGINQATSTGSGTPAKPAAAEMSKPPSSSAAAPAPAPPPHGAMLGPKTYYERLQAEHPAEFVPASVFFTTDPRSAMDRRISFRVKAALVYEAVTGRHVDDHMLRANSLLLALARKCHCKIHTPADDVAAGDPAEVTDERWGEAEKRVVDGIFLVVGFLPKLNDAVAGKNADRDAVDQSFRSRHMLDMVADVIKLENQIPLRDLLAVARHVEGAIAETVRRPEFSDVRESMEREYKPGVTEHNLADVIHGFCWYYSPFSTRKTKTAADSPFKDVVAAAGDRTLLDCLHMSVARPAQGTGKGVPGRPSRMPTARDLRRSGVRIQASENGRAEIAFAQATVRLPVLVHDFKLATVARNLLAREYEEQSKPVTRFFQMMNEIVEDAADVRILRRAGVVRGGGSGGGQEVYELIKNIDGHATYPSVYMAMDREIDKVREYHDQRMASFFVRNRPGVIWASSVAAISVAAIVAARRRRG